MPRGKPKDKRLVQLQREVAAFEKHVKNAKDEKERSFREQQLARAKTNLAKYVQNKPE